LDGDHVLSITGREDRLPVAKAWVPRFRGM
jgi:hypothetical protein